MLSQYDTREQKNEGLPPDIGNPSKKHTRFFRRKTAFLPLDGEINYFCSDFYCLKTLTTMETKQQTDENTETPLNIEDTDTLAQVEGVENHTERENNGDSETKSDNPETDGLKDENAKSDNPETDGLKDENAKIPMENKPSDIPLSKRKKWGEWIKSNPLTTLLITVIAGLLVIAVQTFVQKRIVHHRCYTKPYITFESDFTQVFRLSWEVPNLEYSVGESRWKALGDQNIVFGGNRGKLMLRGRSKTGTGRANISFATDAQVICTGDIRTLVDYKHYDHTDTEQAVFAHLFDGCSQLVVAPELPAKALAVECYRYMFAGCTSLKRAPELPATALADGCYSGMFDGCTSLKRAPELPATTLANGCYLGMFSGCTSLERVPELPATVMAYQCYYCMFAGCISLKRAPILPATALANRCYERLFDGCTSLSFVTMMAVDINKGDFYHWLDGTSTSGRFYKNRNAQWSNDGIVPENWKVKLTDP